MNRIRTIFISIFLNIILLIIICLISIKRDSPEICCSSNTILNCGIPGNSEAGFGDTRYVQRGNFWVLTNYIKARKIFSHNETITFTTHADFTYLDNLVPLLKRWNGPVSISVYSPGEDFEESLRRIIYLRECTENSLVKQFVTFHFYFEYKYFPDSFPAKISEKIVNCLEEPSYSSDLVTYKDSHNLSYPVNVGRNIAREMSSTDFVLVADIELYPSPNLISNFLDMIRRNETRLRKRTPRVFVLPIFEVEKFVSALPRNKEELVHMIRNESAVIFHHYVCDYCHKIPKQDKWLAAPMGDNRINIFSVAKRLRNFNLWEPIFIGTKQEPIYDERLNREGLKDKMTQGYLLCILKYDFFILDNAFIVHRPGVKREDNLNERSKPFIDAQNEIINSHIIPELKVLYGNNPRCSI